MYFICKNNKKIRGNVLMFTHIVFFKLKDRNEKNIKKAKEILMRVDGKIPTLKTVEVGIDVVKSERSYDLALVSTFDSRKDMEAYQIHPVHVNEVLANLKPMLQSSVSVDF